MFLPSRFSAAAYAAVTTCMLAPATVLAAVPKQADYGESKRLDLSEGERQVADPTGGSTGGGLVRTFVGLAIVIAVIYGLYWVLKQVKSSREERATGSGLSSAAVVPLGPNRSLHLVRAGTELVLLGVAEHGVTPIRSYTEEEAAAVGLLRPEPETAATGTAVATARPAGPMTIGQALQKLREKTVRA